MKRFEPYPIKTIRLAPLTPGQVAARLIGGAFLGLALFGAAYLYVLLLVHQGFFK